MGLGKTVEVLACILSHPRPPPSSSIDATKLEIFGGKSAELNCNKDTVNNSLENEDHRNIGNGSFALGIDNCEVSADNNNEREDAMEVERSTTKLDIIKNETNDQLNAHQVSNEDCDRSQNVVSLEIRDMDSLKTVLEVSNEESENERKCETQISTKVDQSIAEGNYNNETSEYEPDEGITLLDYDQNQKRNGLKSKWKHHSRGTNNESETSNFEADEEITSTKSDRRFRKRTRRPKRMKSKAIVDDNDVDTGSDYEPDSVKRLCEIHQSAENKTNRRKKNNKESDDDYYNVMSDCETEEEEESVKHSRKSRYENRQTVGMSSEDHFECMCGHDHFSWDRVQCTRCGSWQHSLCMGFGDEMDDSKYLCPHCWVSDETPLVPSRATLVVTPASIHSQWQEEVERHLKKGSLKWIFYPGMKQVKSNCVFLQPLELADNDLVLVTYEIFRQEVHYVDLPHSNSDSGRRFRNPKRFMASPTPLLAIEWWRICLDEAQMVEGVVTQTAEMALRLSAVNRWCVTGTPIQRSINDLYGLLLFLGEDPYWQRKWWSRLLYEPYRAGLAQPLLNCLKDCFWRNSKKDVLDQIGLPPQSEVTTRLIFSPVEEYFYNRQYQECSAEALRTLNKFQNLDIMLKELDKQTMARVMWPLGRLRQACCHPQAVKGHLLPLQKTTITMEELLTSLIKKTKLECEDFHRQYICALNGLAGIHTICKEYVDAVEKYREVLRVVKEHKDTLKTDKIQQFHTLYNLNQLLRGQKFSSDLETLGDGMVEKDRTDSPPPLQVPPGVGRTLEDETLHEESEKLRNTYLEKCLEKVTVAQVQLQKASETLRDTKQHFQQEGDKWWISSRDAIEKAQLDDALVMKVKEVLSTKIKSKESLSNRFKTLQGLLFVLTNLYDELKKSHKNLVNAVTSLSSTPSQEDVNSAISCHLRPLITPMKRCVYCTCHELFNQYEGQLFCFESGFQKDPLTNEEALWGQTRKGTWADSQLECILKTILTFLKSNRVTSNRHFIDNGNIHIKVFDALKKEFRCLRAVWMQIRDYASALDELEMAKIRLRLRLPDEPKPDIPLPYILEPEEVQPNKLKLLSDRAVAQADLRKKLGQLFYLKNLEKADFGKKGGSNPELCPICQKIFGTQWSVLPCGHCFCVECIRILITQYSMGFRNHSVRCAICRQLASHSEITYINTSPDPNQPNEESTVKGSHSTKVEAVIRCLLKIQKEEPEAKSLVFSSWQLVLTVIEEALTENNISCVTLYSYNLNKSLWQFKHNPNVRVLLLPVHSGANGLNLIEATHVLMVEPLLNPGAEVQALGRVHRIGQTKPTMVHRFIVSSTIEEKIHQACTFHSSDDMTLGELKALFEVK